MRAVAWPANIASPLRDTATRGAFERLFVAEYGRVVRIAYRVLADAPESARELTSQ